MKTCSVFINGASGTTGLNIYNRLSSREDLRLIVLPDDRRKDPSAVKDAMDRSDITFLCLPDEASRQAVAMLENPDTVVIDTSTAHRTAPGWVYGFPELTGRLDMIRSSKRVANPGCHATGFISLVAPLTENGFVAPDAKLTCFSLTGYSGGGKKMIAEYEAEGRDPLLDAPRQYGLSQAHKHLPEMRALCGLESAPIFCPVVAPFFEGMEVTVPLFAEQVKGSLEDLKALYRDYYRGGMVGYDETDGENGFLSAGALAGFDDLRVSVHGSGERILLVARFDNLGKGASGAAIQNMNIVLGLPEDLGLVRKTNG
ncbi:MAG: N-acetyl-gamma-glutamyl-phosphate reductase [Clostridia bacterium]|nr:N-acetyl-gamma-glutamyl-phosphate reductase [Clostridia bacterium]